ncbi:hypothetical protein FN846DRAFT_995424 [Sphaerosporella brunnea]|uniref:Uncharacterized protein n=1 Tax=Sphaerosporella brunnea TaxID=1250544 RepID=A0A5J5ELD9_9PEZI|nr:hypothetical protein FN846DRAFT_995424 [Sphaerosporella brunnea]
MWQATIRLSTTQPATPALAFTATSADTTPPPAMSCSPATRLTAADSKAVASADDASTVSAAMDNATGTNAPHAATTSKIVRFVTTSPTPAATRTAAASNVTNASNPGTASHVAAAHTNCGAGRNTSKVPAALTAATVSNTAPSGNPACLRSANVDNRKRADSESTTHVTAGKDTTEGGDATVIDPNGPLTVELLDNLAEAFRDVNIKLRGDARKVRQASEWLQGVGQTLRCFAEDRTKLLAKIEQIGSENRDLQGKNIQLLGKMEQLAAENSRLQEQNVLLQTQLADARRRLALARNVKRALRKMVRYAEKALPDDGDGEDGQGDM